MRRSVIALSHQSVFLSRHLSGWAGAVLAGRYAAHAEPAEPAGGRPPGRRRDEGGARGTRHAFGEPENREGYRALKMKRGGPSEIRGSTPSRYGARVKSSLATSSPLEIPSATIED